MCFRPAEMTMKKCPECGEEMKVIGRKVTKRLEMIPAKVVIREDVSTPMPAKSVMRMKRIHLSWKHRSRTLSSRAVLRLQRLLLI